MKIAADMIQLIGNTPLVRLNRANDGLDSEGVTKLESEYRQGWGGWLCYG